MYIDYYNISKILNKFKNVYGRPNTFTANGNFVKY